MVLELQEVTTHALPWTHWNQLAHASQTCSTCDSVALGSAQLDSYLTLLCWCACVCTLQASTGLSLKATAGLRLLPGSKADDILAAVRKFLATYPFQVKSDAVGIMDGAHEGAYAWLTLNYLLGRLDKGPAGTVAAIDMGGGSVQEAFALPPEQATAAPAGYITPLKAGGVTYNVYVHRWAR